MEILYYFVMLFLLSMAPFIEAMFSVPVAVMFGMPLVPVLIVAFVGNFLSLLITIWLVYGVKGAAQKRKARKEGDDSENEGFMSKRRHHAKRLWDKYGMPGLAIFGMFLLGGHITALIACSLTKSRMRVTLWMTLSIVIWGGGLGIAAYLGYDFVNYFLVG